MKEFITSISGGSPFALDELALIQSNVQIMTSLISEGLSLGYGDAYRLFGGEITVNNSGLVGATLDITRGAIWKTDEIFEIAEVTGQLLPDFTTEQNVLDTYKWDLLITTNTNVPFENSGISNDIHQYETAILTAAPATWIGIDADILTLKKILELYLNLQIKTSIIVYEESAAIGLNGYYSITNYSGDSVTSDNIRTITLYNKVTMAGGIPASAPFIRVSLSSALSFVVGGVYSMMGKINGIVTELYISVVSITPDTYDIYRTDGVEFAASDVIEYWYNGVNIF